MRITRWELLECSWVSIPADTGAVVTARSAEGQDWKCGASRALPIEDSDAWDGEAAANSIFEHAGGDKFDPAIARKGFLLYDAKNANERGGYKCPIARVIDGAMKVPKGGIKACASRLPQVTGVSDEAKNSAQAVIDHYKEKAGMTTKDGDRARKSAYMRAFGKRHMKRGLLEVANLAYLLWSLGFEVEAAKWKRPSKAMAAKFPACWRKHSNLWPTRSKR